MSPSLLRAAAAAAALTLWLPLGSAAAATLLAPGDLLITGLDADDPDAFVFIPLVDLEAGTEIFLTDSGVTAAGGFRANEGALKYVAPAGGVRAGTAITWAGSGTPDFSPATGFGSGGFLLSTSGDQLIALQGSATSPVFLFALTTYRDVWQAEATSANNSALPPGLTDGVTALALGASSADTDNAEYNREVLTSGTAAALRAAVGNPGNWTRSDTRLALNGEGFTLVDDGGNDLTPPVLISTLPAADATDVATDLGAVLVGFSEPIAAADLTGISLACPDGTDLLTGASVAGNQLTLSVATLPLATRCTVSVPARAVADAAGNPAAAISFAFTTEAAVAGCGAAFTAIPAIQGSGASGAITGPVTTEGVVIADYEGPSPALRGFYLQDPTGDGDPTTADGIFVFSGDLDRVSRGQRVRVTGSAAEFQGQTQVGSVSEVLDCGTGSVTPVDLTLPVPAAVGGVDYLERFEGMLVRFPQTLTVTNHFQLGRFGTIELAAGGRLMQGTEAALPGADALALEAANLLNLIRFDDLLQSQNADPIAFPAPGLRVDNPIRGGDTTTGLGGVLTWTWGGQSASPNAWRVRPVGTAPADLPVFQTNPRPVAAPDVGGRLRVGALNVENWFVTVDDGSPICGPLLDQECRGPDDVLDANGVSEFARKRVKTLAALHRMQADLLAIVEIENTAGVEPLADLAAGLDDLDGAGTWAWVTTGVIGGDAIRNGFLYRPARVRPVGAPAILDDTVDPRAITTKNRPALAQTFEERATGARFTTVVNHFKSKGSDCNQPTAGTNELTDPDLLDGQGNCNLTRTSMAAALLDWLATDPTGAGDSRVLILGDLNAYLREDPIRTLEAGGLVHLLAGAPGSYSYSFDGRWGHLDHALASPELVEDVVAVAEYHIDADEPVVFDYNLEFKTQAQHSSYYAPDEFRVSDHDPVLIGLDLTPPPPLVGDLDGDRALTFAGDRPLLVAAFGTATGASGYRADADLNADGRVNAADYRLWYAAWIAAGRQP